MMSALLFNTPDAAPWMAEVSFWVALATLVASTAAALGIWALVVHLRRVHEEAKRIGVLEDLDQKLGRLVADRADLDVRRIEHVLIDIREGQKRLEDALLRVAQRPPPELASSTDLMRTPGAAAIGERVVNRILALGYERVQIITRAEKLTELAQKDGEVLVEAHRQGVLYKGRALLRDGSLVNVEMNPAYSIFP